MLDAQTRTLKNNIMQRTIRLFDWLSPTQLSAVGLVMAFVCAAFLWRQQYQLALIFWLLNRWFDGIDGIVARTQNKQTDIGGYIDILCDFVAYALVPIALVIGAINQSNLLALVFLLASFYINSASWMYLAAILEKRNVGAAANQETTTITMPGGIVGGFVTIVFYCLFILFPAHIVPLFITMSVLVLLGVLQRLLWAIRTL